ncbi:hypothetical protein D1007_17962 [Hordeum vulgare]|nr:hypothetical protein D1007_17962 [Hordeum vulgare]
MNFIRGQQFDWNERVAAVTEHNRRTTELLVASMSRGEVPTLPPAPPSPGPQPVPPTFEQFLAEYYGTPGTDGSFAGGGPTDGSAHEPQSPITPISQGGGCGGRVSGGGSVSGGLC